MAAAQLNTMCRQQCRAPAPAFSSCSSSGRPAAAAAAARRSPLQQLPTQPQQQGRRRQQLAHTPRAHPEVAQLVTVLAALDIDWTDPDTQIGALGAVLGLGLGIGAPVFYASRDERDDERLAELRALNRATKDETGEYLTEVGAASLRGSEGGSAGWMLWCLRRSGRNHPVA